VARSRHAPPGEKPSSQSRGLRRRTSLITGALGEARVSIHQMVQQGGGDARGALVQVVMLTHEARERDLYRALAQLAGAELMARAPHVVRIVA
jgi:homoserine dehydrogenase